MKRAFAVLALALAGLAGTAKADTFRLVADASPTLPSSDVPNLPGGLALPSAFTTPPVQSQTLSYPELQALWQQAGAAYGIPWQVLAAINKIESNFGRNMGPSSAGAVGWMQFMPSTWLRWGLDADGDGVASPWSAADAIYAAARYLAAAGGATDISRAIFAYNHAQWYVDEVLQLAKVFGTAGAQATFGIDQLGQRLDEARVGVVEINRALVQAVRLQRALERRANRLQAKVEKAELLSDRLEAQKHATQAGVRADAAAAKVAKLRGRLQRAETALSTARDRAQPAGFVAGAQPLTDAPSYDSNYVFPVGGGPSVVSVSHHHHDYPAADIAAPEGSPVYALSDGIVLSAWQLPDARCGIGLTLRTSDGQSWTYCHLAYLAPSVQRGTAVSAGDAVGLVGETGHATGPHLHLQLNPPTSYPQLQPWFERFAGTAFRWQDAPTPEPADGPTPAPTAAPRQTDVFAVAGADSSAETASVVRFSR